jgi:hypothetical protein
MKQVTGFTTVTEPTEDGQLVLWERHQEEVAQAVVEGADLVVCETEYGRNDLVLDLLRETGLWEASTGFRPRLGKENGYDPKLLNQVAALCELAKVGKLQYADPLLRDGKLLVDLGFNLAQVAKRQGEERTALHRDTLRNHYKRIGVREAQRVFYEEHLWHLRHGKWLRKGLYAQTR